MVFPARFVTSPVPDVILPPDIQRLCHKVGAVYLVTRSAAASASGPSIDVRELGGSPEDASLMGRAFPINASVVHRCAEVCLRLAGVEVLTDDLPRTDDDDAADEAAAAVAVAVSDGNDHDSADQVPPTTPTPSPSHPPYSRSPLLSPRILTLSHMSPATTSFACI